MRTTLTLDEDVALLLRQRCDELQQSFKETVNEALRTGLSALSAPAPADRTPYRLLPVSLGQPRLPNLDDVHEALVFAEGEDYR